jgi:hypothetical protein
MDPNQQAKEFLQHIGPMIFVFWGFIYLIKITLYIIPSWQIAKKAGLSGPIALLAAIPLVGRLIMLYVIGFSDWKVVPVVQNPYYAPPPPPSYPPAPTYPPAPPTQL